MLSDSRDILGSTLYFIPKTAPDNFKRFVFDRGVTEEADGENYALF